MTVTAMIAGSKRTVAAVAAAASMALLAPPAHAHHSYAMYDGTVYRVFTGVIVRVIPNAAHFEIHFVPLNKERTALLRDEKGEPLVWVVQMESAAQAYKEGITREAFAQGTVFSSSQPSLASRSAILYDSTAWWNERILKPNSRARSSICAISSAR